MKALLILVVFGIAVFFFSFIEKHDNGYNHIYFTGLAEFKSTQADLQETIAAADLSSTESIEIIRKEIERARIKLKNIDFWLRYFEPNAYRKINGPLPVEWENEVFEKFEKPYRREGAGLSLAELSLDQNRSLRTL